MNAVEIEEAVSDLAAQPFDAAEFPFSLLMAFGNKETTVRRLRASNKSDVPGGVIQQGGIHIATCASGEVEATLDALRASPKTAAMKAKFILATDGEHLLAEDLGTGDPLSCDWRELPNHFGFLLPLAGISTVKAIKENPIDVKATGRLNKLYVELLKHNPDWQSETMRPELNRLMARLIFCFFAEDTGIFPQKDQFTKAVTTLTEASGANTHTVLGELFRAMATHPDRRRAEDIKSWADPFLYVNGGLFSDAGQVPTFTRDARNYLLRAGELNWQSINPDIFGSMIQAVADDDERGELGMHYTSVPNILKVLNPLFLDDLRAELEAAGDSLRKLRTLRRRIANIRVFDPACGSGNFLVIAYIQMREIEHEIVQRTGDDARSVIPLTNFYGIEIKGFAAEIARLALLIAEFQSDARLIDQMAACANVLPLHATGQITIGNALELDWLEICPPPKPGAESIEIDLAGPTGRLALEPNAVNAPVNAVTYVCGNPPYKGSQDQTPAQKAELAGAFAGRLNSTGALDYVSGWLIKARDYGNSTPVVSAFVTTKTINQGRQVSLRWPLLLDGTCQILFAHTPFDWSNLAAKAAGVTVSIAAFGPVGTSSRRIFEGEQQRLVPHISPYLIGVPTAYVHPRTQPLSGLQAMSFGSMPNDGGGLLLTPTEARFAIAAEHVPPAFIRRLYGAEEFTQGVERRCIWITERESLIAEQNSFLASRIESVRRSRSGSARETTKMLAAVPYRFGEVRQTGSERIIAVPAITTENRDYLPAGILDRGAIITNKIYALYDAPLWNLSLIVSRLHWNWIGTVCARFRTGFSYSNTLGWNTFPVPTLTVQNQADLTRCAEDILLAREAHFPATIADLYDPDAMPDDLRRAHERNDETLERIYIGRRFRNDTERLEKLFELYTRMTASDGPGGDKAPSKKSRKAA